MNYQLQILTAAAKLYLKKPDEMGWLFQDVLTLAAEKSNNPDVRDRYFSTKQAKMLIITY